MTPLGERVVQVAAERLSGWMTRFEDRHGLITVSSTPTEVILTAADGAAAVIEVPYPPLSPNPPPTPKPLLTGSASRTALVEHVVVDRRVGVILVRRGGYAVGLYHGRTLVRSKVGRAYVQGTTKAGGWSQQRYARRRANQTDQAYAEAADVVATQLLPYAAGLAAVTGGGDRVGVQAVLADPRLSALRALLQARVVPTPDPRLRVLEAFADELRAVRITLNPLA